MNNFSTHPKLAVVCYYQLPPGTLNSSLCGFLCCFNAQVKYDKKASAERTRTNRSTEQPCSPRLVSLWRGEQVPLKEEEICEQPPLGQMQNAPSALKCSLALTLVQKVVLSFCFQ